ncbi:hypothetical protein MTR_8g022930 [Medicago truncatula]|uniref:Uncharacterized protein n=1 Tax=Medicago truncatula TaxID=3880 RepID=G7L951_MEDTR|nr:hypothetical protein MTR_8g022930 [Medicago truncatula]
MVSFLFEPSKTKSLGGNYCGFVIVDHYSRFTYGHGYYLVRMSHETFDAFDRFAKLIQNQNSLKITYTSTKWCC